MLNLPSTALILVTVAPNPRDLEIARVLGWYRIPLARAPKVIAVDYLAFYQPASFGERKWSIDFYAPVKGYELVTRCELLRNEPHHPRANEEYYKIILGDLLPLEKPIRAERWKRITFLYTIGEIFNQAEVISDLIVKSDDRELLWQALREKAAQYSIDPYNEQTSLPSNLPFEVLASFLGIKEEWLCPY